MLIIFPVMRYNQTKVQGSLVVRKHTTVKVFICISAVIMVAMQIFGITGLLIPYSTEEISIRFNGLIYPYRFVLIAVFLLNFALLLYILYSLDIIENNKSEFAKQYVVVADVGLLLCNLLHIIDIYLWHGGFFGITILTRLAMILVLLRVITAYQGRRSKMFIPQLPFDIYLGWMQYLLSSALATSLFAVAEGDGLFSVSVRAVLLILALTVLSMTIGLRFLNIFSMVTVLAVLGAIAAYHLAAAPGYDGRFPEIYIAAILSMAALVAGIIAAIIRKRRDSSKTF